MTSTSKTNHTSTPISPHCSKQAQFTIKLACEVLELAEHIPLFTHSARRLSALLVVSAGQ